MSKARELLEALEGWRTDAEARLRHARGSAAEVKLAKVAHGSADYLNGLHNAEVARSLAEEGGTGIALGEVGSDGELRVVLTVDAHAGDTFLSRQFWEAIGEHAGWRPRDGGEFPALRGWIEDVEAADINNLNTKCAAGEAVLALAELDRRRDLAARARRNNPNTTGAIATLRAAFRNDGADGESVHLVCDELEGAAGICQELTEAEKRMYNARVLIEKHEQRKGKRDGGPSADVVLQAVKAALTKEEP